MGSGANVATRKKTARLRVKKDTLRVLSGDEVERVRGGNNGNGRPRWQAGPVTHTNSPNESRYCL